MAISPSDAAQALDDISQAETRMRQFAGYEKSSPFFLLWGVLWFVASAASDVFPTRIGPIWIATDLIGVAASTYLGIRGVDRTCARSWGGRYLGTVAVYLAFAVATLWLLSPTSPQQVYAYFSLLIAAIYMAMGIWTGPRYLAIGLGIFVLTLAGYVLLASHFYLWMAIVGGGALVLTSLWMRRA